VKKKNDPSTPDDVQAHASFLRAILALDSSDPQLPRFVPPASADAEPPASDTTAPDTTEQATQTRRLSPRLPPRRPR
jgi:hypothetical protein